MDVLMPQIGETVTEGTVSTWYKSVGDPVAPGDNLFEIETDKVAMEVQATEGGVLLAIHVGNGETAPVGAVLAVIGEAGTKVEAPAKAQAAPAKAEKPVEAKAETPAPRPAPAHASGNGATPPRRAVADGPAEDRLDPFRPVRAPEASYGPVDGPDGLKLTPLARRLIRQNGIDISALANIAQGKRISKKDVLAAMEKGVGTAPSRAAEARGLTVQVPPVTLQAGDEVVPFNRIRRTTAKALGGVWQSMVHVSQGIEIDFTTVDRARKAAKVSFQERHGLSLTYLPFLARAVALALTDFPKVNSAYSEDGLIVRRSINLGIAIDLAHDGLVVPVLRNVDDLSLTGLARQLDGLVKRARAGQLGPDDFDGATYAITNNGSFGTTFTTPIINPGNAAILSMDAIVKKPVVIEVDGSDVIVPRPVGMLVQSFDHRAFDGAYSAAYLSRLKELLERRDWSAELG
jgi:2-oxoglutarate dehydrogenase E2 component (dihydrolipoamide succinyltransferase)